MLLNYRQRLLRECLQGGVVALVGVGIEQVDRLLMAIDLLLGVRLIKIRIRCGVEVVDQFLMLGVELRRQIDVDLFAGNDAFQLLGGLAVRSRPSSRQTL